MPKITLTFLLPEEEDEFKMAVRANDYYVFLWELAQDVRDWLKHGHKFKTADDVLEEISKRLADVQIWDIK